MLQKPFVRTLVLIAVLCIPLFSNLDRLPIVNWDESRLGESAVEMHYTNNWLVVKFAGQPEMWSTKPPLMIWLQALMIKVFGVTELAVRLPAALAALATCLLLYLFFAKKFKAPALGTAAAMVLVTTSGYVAIHGTRTGDYDAPLTLFMTGYALAYYLYLEEQRQKYLYATFLLFTAAVLTKSVAGLMFLPGLAIYTVYKRKLLFVVARKYFYFAAAIFAFFVFGYYALREHYNPGYIKAVIENELWSRYSTVKEFHQGDGWSYFYQLINTCFGTWYVLVLPGIAVGWLFLQKKFRDITVLAAITALLYLVVISNAATQLTWYLLPMYPLLAVLAALILYTVYEGLQRFDGWKQVLSYNIIPAAFFFVVFLVPYRAIVDKVTTEGEPYLWPGVADMKQLMKDDLHGEHRLDGCAIMDVAQQQGLMFYYCSFMFMHKTISAVAANEIDPFSKVCAYKPESKKYLEDSFKIESRMDFGSAAIYRLAGKKN